MTALLLTKAHFFLRNQTSDSSFPLLVFPSSLWRATASAPPPPSPPAKRRKKGELVWLGGHQHTPSKRASKQAGSHGRSALAHSLTHSRSQLAAQLTLTHSASVCWLGRRQRRKRTRSKSNKRAKGQKKQETNKEEELFLGKGKKTLNFQADQKL